MKKLNERKIGAGTSVENLILFTIAIVIVGVVAALIWFTFNNTNLINKTQEIVIENHDKPLVIGLDNVVLGDVSYFLGKFSDKYVKIDNSDMVETITLKKEKYDDSGKSFSIICGQDQLNDNGITQEVLESLLLSDLLESVETDGTKSGNAMDATVDTVLYIKIK